MLCHICNDRGGWGKGFVLAVSQRWSDPERYYRRWLDTARAAKLSVLGQVQFVHVAADLVVANMVAQHGYKPTKKDGIPLRYDALRQCLREVRDYVTAANGQVRMGVHMPRIGTGLASGSWDRIEPLIQSELRGVRVTVYDLKKG